MRSTATRRGRGRPTDRDAGSTRAVIIEAAQRLFGSAGYAGVSMEALAAECGLNARAIYYHFLSKRDVFRVATQQAFARFGEVVAAEVFSRSTLQERLTAYAEVYRSLHATDPHLVPFIGMVLVDHRASSGSGRSPASPGAELRELIEVLVDESIARGEVHPSLDRRGAVGLLVAIGIGLSLASIDDPDGFPAMLDALDLLTAGNLFAEPAGAFSSRQG